MNVMTYRAYTITRIQLAASVPLLFVMLAVSAA
jgi:hypothetical protein